MSTKNFTPHALLLKFTAIFLNFICNFRDSLETEAQNFSVSAKDVNCLGYSSLTMVVMSGSYQFCLGHGVVDLLNSTQAFL